MGKKEEEEDKMSFTKLAAYMFIMIIALLFLVKTVYFSRYTKGDIEASYQTIMIGVLIGYFIIYRFL